MQQKLKAIVVAAAGLMILTLALTGGGRVAAQGMKPLLVQIINTASNPIPVESHVDRVMLRTQGGPPTGVCPNFSREVLRILPDGSFVQSFTVPPGKMLVLTDLEAIVEQRESLPWSPGDLASVRAFFASASSTVMHAHAPLTPQAVSAEVVAVSTHLESGGVIGSNVAVCISAGITRLHGGYAADLAEARVHGYLIDE